MVVLFLCIEKVLNKGCKLPFFRAFYSFTGFFSKKYKITLKRRFMPRKTLGRRKECVGLFCQRQQKSPHGALVLALLSLYNALRRGSCQEYRGINSRLLYGIFHFHFDGFIIDSFEFSTKGFHIPKDSFLRFTTI